MSKAQLENNFISDAQLIELYELESGPGRDKKWMDTLRLIHNWQTEEKRELPAKIDDFVANAEEMLKAQLSRENVKSQLEHILGQKKTIDDEVENPEKEGSGILHDAKTLFKDHVVSVFKETKKDLLSGSALSTLGTILSLPGRLINGISKFWGEFIKKRPLLKELDKIIITPLVVSAYVQFLPVVGIIKACEFVGGAMCAYAKADKGEKWSAIQNSASKMLGDTIDHMDRIAGVNMVAPFIKEIDKAHFSDEVKTGLKAFFTSVQAWRSIEGFEKNPKTFIFAMGGITLASNSAGLSMPDSISLAGMMLSGKKDGKKIDIKAIVADEKARHVVSHFAEVFGVRGILPSSINLKETINKVQDSTKVNDKEKIQMIELVVSRAVKQELASQGVKDPKSQLERLSTQQNSGPSQSMAK